MRFESDKPESIHTGIAPFKCPDSRWQSDGSLLRNTCFLTSMRFCGPLTGNGSSDCSSRLPRPAAGITMLAVCATNAAQKYADNSTTSMNREFLMQVQGGAFPGECQPDRFVFRDGTCYLEIWKSKPHSCVRIAWKQSTHLLMQAAGCVRSTSRIVRRAADRTCWR